MRSCCDYGEAFEDEGLMPPVHECPAVSPLPADDLGQPLTALEHDIMRSLNYMLGRAAGRVVELPPRRWK